MNWPLLQNKTLLRLSHPVVVYFAIIQLLSVHPPYLLSNYHRHVKTHSFSFCDLYARCNITMRHCSRVRARDSHWVVSCVCRPGPHPSFWSSLFTGKDKLETCTDLLMVHNLLMGHKDAWKIANLPNSIHKGNYAHN